MVTEITFYARGDSPNANNASVNVQPPNTTPTTALTFTSLKSGDVRLEYNGGAPDPDTWVIVNGTTCPFTLILTGTLPMTQKFARVAGQDLRGAEIAVIEANGQRYVFLTDGSGTPTLMNAFPNGAAAIDNVSSGGAALLICFVSGTLIATPSGERPVEDLAVGDLVTTAFGGVRAIRWIGRRRITGSESLRDPQVRPVMLPAGSLGNGLPHRELGLSPQHRLLMSGWRVEVNAGCHEALVPARHLLGGAIRRAPAGRGCTYWHLLLDDHAPVLANGVPAESFQPAPRNVAALDPEARAELMLMFPDLAQRPDAAPTLRAAESRAVMAAH
jgi:hypothetical protein